MYKGTNSLIILDDCACSQDVKNRTSQLVNLGFSTRHLNLSTIVITQQLTSISKLVTLYNSNHSNMKAVMDDHLYGLSNGEMKHIISKLKNNKYATLEINLRYPYGYNLVIPQIK